MFMHKSKKGFTIVELVIVIAVIAILAAVLIPTFSNLVKKANMSADQQAVRQMNTALAADGAVTPTDIFKLHEVLSEMGLTSKDYKPLTKDTYFFWDADKNRVLHVDDKYAVITPAEFAGQAYTADSNWFSLNLEIKEEEVAITNNAVTVSNGAQMAYVLNKLNEGTTKELDIAINGTVDMMGAAFDLPQFDKDDDYDVTISGGTIKNAVAVEYAQNATSEIKGHNGVYNCALIPTVVAGNSVTISNVVFENLGIKNTSSGNVALLIGILSGEATIENVTINNSTVVGHRSVGALVGQIGAGGELTLKGNINLNNVEVMTVGGRSAMLVGHTYNKSNIVIDGANINLNNCSFGVYKCEQNTGAGLGLTGNDLSSYTLRLVDGKLQNGPTEQKKFFENALIFIDEDTDTAITSGADFVAKYGKAGTTNTVKGW